MVLFILFILGLLGLFAAESIQWAEERALNRLVKKSIENDRLRLSRRKRTYSKGGLGI